MQDIKLLIPQRDPIMMVDRLESVSGDEATASLTVGSDNYFVADGETMSEVGLIEHIAQSASAFAGYRAVSQGASEPPVGFIGEIKRMKIIGAPRVGDHLLTTISMGPMVDGVMLIMGETRVGEQVLASTRMKVAFPAASPLPHSKEGEASRNTNVAGLDGKLFNEIPFFHLLSLDDAGDGKWQARVRLNDRCRVYRGHFPGNPVSPGVCNVWMLKDIAENILAKAEANDPSQKKNRKLFMQSIDRCRFTEVISPQRCPELCIDMHLSPSADGTTLVEAAISDATTQYLDFKGKVL